MLLKWGAAAVALGALALNGVAEAAPLTTEFRGKDMCLDVVRVKGGGGWTAS